MEASRIPQPSGLARLAWYARLYFLIAGQYVKARLSYRLDFFVSSLGMVISILPGLLAVLVVFRSIPSMAGWERDELVFLYGFALLSTSLLQIVFDNLWQLRNQVQDGSFVKHYFRPLNMLFYFTANMVDLKGFAQLATAIVLISWSSLRLHIAWTAARIAGFAVLLSGASLVMVGLLIAGASAAFWIVNSFSVLSLFSRFRDYAKYPLSIYSSPIRLFFTILIPVGFIAFYPGQWILHPDQSSIAVWFTPAAGLACFGLGVLVWSRGVRTWSGTGS